jgi:alpha/beta superfamily hydrolase
MLVPVLAAALVAASAPAPAPSGRSAAAPAHGGGAPAAPPNGTYVYALSRNGTDQGTTTVVVQRRDEAREIEVDEAGSLGAMRAHLTAAFRYDDLLPATYVATYQAPFERESPLGAARHVGSETGFYDQTTVRYRPDGVDETASVDAGPVLPAPPSLPHAAGPPLARFVFDAPLMATVLFVPAFRHRLGSSDFAPAGVAFGAGGGVGAVPMRMVRLAPRAAKTPATDDVVQIDGVATIWFDRGNDIVHEAHFDQLNLDARLVSYTRALRPAPFLPEPSPAPEPRLAANEASFSSEDGTTLAGVVDLPSAPKGPVPIVVLVPPGPNASRNFGGGGPNPMFPGLARAFAGRGYAVLRYDTRGIGKSDGSSRTETWEEGLADARAAVRAAAETDGVDPKRVFVAGYGSGADLALAAAAQSDVPLAGAVALGPTVRSYRACAQSIAEAGATTPEQKARADADFARTAGHIDDEIVHDRIDGRPYERNDGTWAKTSFGHDPSVLALRAKLPLFVLHPGIPMCDEPRDRVEAYDDRLRAENPRATIVIADDLTATFGGRYDADSPASTAEFFPYRFDASTASAIADWLDGPKAAVERRLDVGAGARAAPPPPPPAPISGGGSDLGYPNPHARPAAAPTPAAAQPGQPALPETLGSPTPVITVAPAPPPTPAPSPR